MLLGEHQLRSILDGCLEGGLGNDEADISMDVGVHRQFVGLHMEQDLGDLGVCPDVLDYPEPAPFDEDVAGDEEVSRYCDGCK